MMTRKMREAKMRFLILRLRSSRGASGVVMVEDQLGAMVVHDVLKSCYRVIGIQLCDSPTCFGFDFA